jgi:hypothetical protein
MRLNEKKRSLLFGLIAGFAFLCLFGIPFRVAQTVTTLSNDACVTIKGGCTTLQSNNCPPLQNPQVCNPSGVDGNWCSPTNQIGVFTCNVSSATMMGAASWSTATSAASGKESSEGMEPIACIVNKRCNDSNCVMTAGSWVCKTGGTDNSSGIQYPDQLSGGDCPAPA